jgi:hypothetical protein
MIINKIEFHDENTLNEFIVRKSPMTPNRLLFLLESFEGKNKKVWQELYKEDVEALILFLQQNMPDE